MKSMHHIVYLLLLIPLLSYATENKIEIMQKDFFPKYFVPIRKDFIPLIIKQQQCLKEEVIEELRKNILTDVSFKNCRIAIEWLYHTVIYRSKDPYIFSSILPYLFTEKLISKWDHGSPCLQYLSCDTSTFNRALYELKGDLKRIKKGNRTLYYPLLFIIAQEDLLSDRLNPYVRVIDDIDKPVNTRSPYGHGLRIHGKNFIRKSPIDLVAFEDLFLHYNYRKAHEGEEELLQPTDRIKYWEYSLKPTLYPKNILYKDAIEQQKSFITILLCLKSKKINIPKDIYLYHIFPSLCSEDMLNSFKNRCKEILNDIKWSVDEMKKDNENCEYEYHTNTPMEALTEEQAAFFNNFKKWYTQELDSYLATIHNVNLVKAIIKRANEAQSN